MFDLTFKDTTPYGFVGTSCATGSVLIGDSEETFLADLYVLSKRDYLRQWLEASLRVTELNDDSAIITSFSNEGGTPIGLMWPLYVTDCEVILVQNHLILREIVGDDFSVRTCHRHVPVRRVVTDDGDPISEWKTTVNEVAAFAARVRERLAELECTP